MSQVILSKEVYEELVKTLEELQSQIKEIRREVRKLKRGRR